VGTKSNMMVLLGKQWKGPEEEVDGRGSSTDVREFCRNRGASEGE